MKKKKKKIRKKILTSKIKKSKKKSKSKTKKKKSIYKKKRKVKKNNIKIIKRIKSKSDLGKKGIISKSVRLEENLKNKFSFRFNFNFLAIDRFLQKFFEGIEFRLIRFKEIRLEEKRKIKLEKIEQAEKEKIKLKNQKIEDEKAFLKEREIQLKQEQKLERERARDIKLFLRKEQALLRKEQAERQKKFLQELKLEKQIEKFRVREVKELEQLEKIALKEKRDDYSGLQERIEKLKLKYQQIRDQKIRERVEALGIETQEGDDRAQLLQREREYTLARQKIEFALESFYRSANSLVFQLNKRYITKHMSILRCIDRRFETGEIFIKWDETIDDEWLVLIYIKNNSPDEGIVIEDKTNEEKNISHEFKPSEIFKASDLMVDSLTQLIAKKRSKSS